jgi:ABC-type sugar transport system permease subunit
MELSARRKERLTALLFIAPALLLFLWWRYIPIGNAIYLGFFRRVPGGGRTKEFVGFLNYINAFQDRHFLKSLWVTVYFTVILTSIQVVLALGLAMLVNRKIRGIEVFRVIYLIPVIVAETVEVGIWKLMFYEAGMINGILSWFHIPPQPFLTSPNQALGCIIMTLTYRGVGFWMMFYLAGLNNIENSLYEVASIAGASSFQKFRYVTLPLLMPVTTFIVISGTILNFMVFTPVYMMTGGGPLESTNLMIYRVYKTVMGYGDIYGGSAIAMIAFIIISVIVGLQFLLMRRQ